MHMTQFYYNEDFASNIWSRSFYVPLFIEDIHCEILKEFKYKNFKKQKYLFLFVIFTEHQDLTNKNAEIIQIQWLTA